MRILSGRFHKEKFGAQSVGAHLSKHAPSVLRRAAHCITESIPLLLGLNGLLLTSGGCRRSRHVVVLLVLLRSLSRNVAVDIHGDNFGEKAVGVIGQIIRVGQDLLHTTCTLGNSVSLSGLLEEHILELTSVSIQNSRGLEAELFNDLDACRAEFVVAGRRSLRGSLGL